MSDFMDFLEDFAIGYAVGYVATTLVEENQRRNAERQGVQTLDDQVKEKMNNGQ